MNVTTGFAIWAIAMLALAALARNHAGARIGVVLAAALLPLPLFVSGEPMLRMLLTFTIIVGLASSVDFASGRNPQTVVGRLAYVLAFLTFADAYSATPTPRRFDARSATRALVALAIGGAAVLCWIVATDLPQAARFLAWHLAGGVMVFAAAAIQASLVLIVTTGFGVTLRPVHDSPHASRTVAEFWSSRWNLMTGRWLRQYCFLPFVRRSPLLALFATFTVSAAMHVYLILIPGDPQSWLMWTAFFMAQPMVILAERRLRVRRWRRAAGHAWTIGWMLLLSPLLFIPILKLIDPSL